MSTSNNETTSSSLVMRWHNDLIIFIRSNGSSFSVQHSTFSIHVPIVCTMTKHNRKKKEAFLHIGCKTSDVRESFHFYELSLRYWIFCLYSIGIWISVRLFERMMCNFSRVNKSVLFKRFVRHRLCKTQYTRQFHFECNLPELDREHQGRRTRNLSSILFSFLKYSLWEWANNEFFFFSLNFFQLQIFVAFHITLEIWFYDRFCHIHFFLLFFFFSGKGIVCVEKYECDNYISLLTCRWNALWFLSPKYWSCWHSYRWWHCNWNCNECHIPVSFTKLIY